MLTFTVIGEAQPKGSTKILPIRRRFPLVLRTMRDLMTSVVVTSDNPQVKSWQSRVAFEATTALRHVQIELTGPVQLQIEFYLRRPSGLAKSYDGPHLKKPDLDKCIRAVKDALTGIVWRDDSQVTCVIAGKAYARVGEEPRAVVTIRPIVTDRPAPLLTERTV